MISFWSRLIDLIAPRPCMVCGCRLAIEEEVLCAACNLHLPRTGFAANPLDNPMARRFWGRIPVERASALFYYEAGSEASHIIHAMKYYNHPEAATAMGRMAAEEFLPFGFFQDIDLIIPVPLTRKRERQRGYNQSSAIAEGVAQVTHIPIVNNAVERKAFVSSQTRKTLRERMENVEHAFEATGKADLEGKHILIIDDIVTSGATICACVNAMRDTADFKASILTLGVVK
ncbi:MAG: ComF family protein [Prevotella sp.]|nr:ComF family protein [Prevotella sp.]